MDKRLDVLCGEEWNIIHLMGEGGIRKLGKFKILDDIVDYRHLDNKVEFSVGMVFGSNLKYSNPKNSGNMRFIINKRYLVYFENKKPKYLFNVRNGLVVTVEVE